MVMEEQVLDRPMCHVFTSRVESHIHLYYVVEVSVRDRDVTSLSFGGCQRFAL